MMTLTAIKRVPLQYLLVFVLVFTVILVSLIHSSRKSPTVVSVIKVEQSNNVYVRYDASKYLDRHGRIVLPSDDVLNAMSFGELEDLLFRYQETIETVCPRQRHIGLELDGGYHVCETLMPNKSCLAYSFGNRKDYTFDDGLAAYYNCEVHSFDPDDTQVDHQHAEKVFFHKLGIGGKDEMIKGTWDIKTLDTIRTLLHHQDRELTLLKIDTEGAEWDGFKQMLAAKSLQRANVKILVVEFHTIFFKRDRQFYLSILQTMRGLYEAGFRRYFFRMWHGGCMFTSPETGMRRTGCHEVHFMRDAS